MSKQLKTLGLAVFAAVAELVTLDRWSSGYEKHAAGYEQFNGRPSAITEGVRSMVMQVPEKAIHIYKSSQSAPCEFRVAAADDLNKPITLGNSCYVGNSNNCYVGYSRSILDTRELSAPNVGDELTRPNSYRVSVNSSIQTQLFHELSNQKIHLA